CGRSHGRLPQRRAVGFEQYDRPLRRARRSLGRTLRQGTSRLGGIRSPGSHRLRRHGLATRGHRAAARRQGLWSRRGAERSRQRWAPPGIPGKRALLRDWLRSGSRRARDETIDERFDVIISRAPVRFSLGGGGTDIPAYYEQFGGYLVASAIDKYIYVSANKRFYDDIRLSYSKTEIVPPGDQNPHRIFPAA